MATSVWLFEPRSHGRRRGAARAHNGAPLPGRHPSSRVPRRSASPALCPCGHAASFRRRASLVGSVFRPGDRGRTCVCGWPARVQAPRAGGTGALCPWLASPCASPPSEGHGRPCARLLEAATGRFRACARAGWLVRMQYTSGRSQRSTRALRPLFPVPVPVECPYNFCDVDAECPCLSVAVPNGCPCRSSAGAR